MNRDAGELSSLGAQVEALSPAQAWPNHWSQVRQDAPRIGLVFGLGLAITCVVALMASKQYTAEASLLLRLGREYMYTPEVGDANGRTPLAYDREQTIQSETRILLSRDVLETAVDQLGVAYVYPKLAQGDAPPDMKRGRAVLMLEKALDAELLKNTNLMQVQLKHADPQVAARTLAVLIDAYLQKRQGVFAGIGIKSAEAEFKAQEGKLQAVEAKLSKFKRARGFVAFTEEQSLLLAQRSALELKQSDVALSQAQAGGRVTSLRTRMPAVPAEVTLSSETQRSDAAESTLKLLMDLKLKERDVSAKFNDTEPMVQDVRQDIALANEHLKLLRSDPPRLIKVGRNPVRDAAEADLEHSLADQSQASAGQSSLATRLSSIDKRLAQMADSERDWHDLDRTRRLAEADYEAAAKRLREERMMADLDRQRQSNVTMVQAPKVPLEGRSARAAIVGVGMALSLAAALLTAFICAWRRGEVDASDDRRRVS